MEVFAGLTGPFPRSEALVAATRDLDRGRATASEVAALYRTAEGEVSALETRLRLAPQVGGYLEWADLFRPFSESWRGFKVGPVTRWFETNTFFRQPILGAPPERMAGAIRRRLPPGPSGSPSGAKVLLPGPYTFAGLVDDRTGEGREALIRRFGRLLAEEVAELRGAGFGAFQFQEPLLVTDPPRDALAEATLAAYRAIAEGGRPAPTIVWTFFGDPGPSEDLLARLPVSAVGVDLSETDPASLGRALGGKGLGLGCLDPRTTLAETAGEIAEVVGSVVDRLRPTQLWIGPGAPLDLLPAEAAARKLAALPAARSTLATAGRS